MLIVISESTPTKHTVLENKSIDDVDVGSSSDENVISNCPYSTIIVNSEKSSGQLLQNEISPTAVLSTTEEAPKGTIL